MGRRPGTMLLGMLMTALAVGSAVACPIDAWIITTKARIALLTTEGAGGSAVMVDTEEGQVTLSGAVESLAQKVKAEDVVRDVAGVSSVKNRVRVEPMESRGGQKFADGNAKNTISAAIASQESLEGVAVKSVRNGVVVLDGLAPTLPHKLRAIETAYEHAGVRLVVTQIEIWADRLRSPTRAEEENGAPAHLQPGDLVDGSVGVGEVALAMEPASPGAAAW